MRTLFPILIITLICAACKTPRLVQQHTFTTELGRVLPYEEVLPKKGKPVKLALIIPDNPDTLDLAQSELARMLIKNSYRVIIPGKPGNDTREKIELDNKNYRIQDINNLLKSIDTAEIRDFVIIGIGEGGYLVPDISYSLAPAPSFVINAGPASPLQEYKNLVSDSIINHGFLNPILAANFVFTKDELAPQIARIEENPFGEPQLFGGSNAYWVSYYEDPLMNRIIKPGGKTYWIISNNYPLISANNKDLAEGICLRLPYLTYKPIKGKGNFNNDEEMKLLIETIEKAINNPPQSY